MKLQDIGNVGSNFGKSRKVSSWHFVDGVDTDNTLRRSVYHYSTLMGEIVLADGETEWVFHPVSTGWGSVSDQGGMNKIIRNFGWYYSRKGGEAKYLQV